MPHQQRFVGAVKEKSDQIRYIFVLPVQFESICGNQRKIPLIMSQVKIVNLTVSFEIDPRVPGKNSPGNDDVVPNERTENKALLGAARCMGAHPK